MQPRLNDIIDYRQTGESVEHCPVAPATVTFSEEVNMKVSIVHDSQRGNGRKVAEKMGEVLESLGATVLIGHQSETTPESVAEQSPDLLIVGAAIRRFMTGPASKRWAGRLAAALKANGRQIACGAFFITHLMTRKAAEPRAAKFGAKFSAFGIVGQLSPEWFSGQVKEMSGPLVDGTLENADRFARELFAWAQTTMTGTPG
jgi:flavodoxin